MRRTLIATSALAFLFAAASGAGAQSITTPYRYIETKHSVGLFGGYLRTDPGIVVDTLTGAEIALGPKSAPVVGAQYEIRFAGPLSGQVAVSFSPTERSVYAPNPNVREVVPVEVGTEPATILMADAGIHFRITGPRTWNGLAPYVTALGGVVADLRRGGASEEQVPQNSRFDLGPSFAVGAAVGTEWFPTRRLSLRVEARDRLWQIEAPEGLRGNRRDASDWTNNVAFTFGGALHF